MRKFTILMMLVLIALAAVITSPAFSFQQAGESSYKSVSGCSSQKAECDACKDCDCKDCCKDGKCECKDDDCKCSCKGKSCDEAKGGCNKGKGGCGGK